MSFKVAETYADITKKYLLDSLNYQYRGKDFKFSDDLLTILESDFKRKAKNLDWLFQGKTRISLTPSPEALFQSISQDSIVSDFIVISEAAGYGVDAHNFTKGYLIIDKQPVKLHKVKEALLKAPPPPLPKDLEERLVSKALELKVNKYKPELVPINSSSIQTLGDVAITSKSWIVSVHKATQVTTRWSSAKGLDVEYINTLLNASEVIMSIDINDYITCSEGSFSSCMSMNSSSTRHLGWMMHYRSDFSVMTFTHKKGDSFYKTGRSWTFLKLTEDGAPYARPFYKLSRTYGELNPGHISVVDAYVQERIEHGLGLKDPKKHTDHKAVQFGQFKYIVSPNMQNTTSGVNGTGYFDWPGDSTGYWSKLPLWEYEGQFPVTPFTDEVYSRGPMCLFNFPDALDIEGNATTASLFNNEPSHGTHTHIGWNEHYKHFVTCNITGAKTLLRDALEISDGVFIHKDQAIRLLAGKPLEQVLVTETVASAIPTIEVSDEDVVDF